MISTIEIELERRKVQHPFWGGWPFRRSLFTFRVALLLLFSLFTAHCSLPAQTPSNISLKYLGLTIHPFGDRTAHLQPYKLDPRARFVLNFGGALGYERFFWQDVFSVKVLEAVFADCSAGLASVSHVALRGTFLHRKRHRLSIGLGPALMIRQDWGRLPDYQPSGLMNTGYIKPLGPVQWKLFWVGIEVEYDVSLSDRLAFSASLTPGIPMAVTMGCGLKYWFNTAYKEKIYLPKVEK